MTMRTPCACTARRPAPQCRPRIGLHARRRQGGRHRGWRQSQQHHPLGRFDGQQQGRGLRGHRNAVFTTTVSASGASTAPTSGMAYRIAPDDFRLGRGQQPLASRLGGRTARSPRRSTGTARGWSAPPVSPPPPTAASAPAHPGPSPAARRWIVPLVNMDKVVTGTKAALGPLDRAGPL